MKRLHQKDWLYFVDTRQESESNSYCFEWKPELRKCLIPTGDTAKYTASWLSYRRSDCATVDFWRNRSKIFNFLFYESR